MAEWFESQFSVDESLSHKHFNGKQKAPGLPPTLTADRESPVQFNYRLIICRKQDIEEKLVTVHLPFKNFFHKKSQSIRQWLYDF